MNDQQLASNTSSNDSIIVSIDMSDLITLMNHYIDQKETKVPVLKKIDKAQKKGPLMSAREVSRYLQIKTQILYYLVERKSIPFIKKKDFLYFDKNAIQEWFGNKENISLLENIQQTNFFSSL